MGNAQSSSHSRPHNRLAKPRTSSNVAVRGQKNDSQQSSLASRYTQLSVKDRQQIKSQLLSPLETEFENTATDQDSNLPVSEDLAVPAFAASASLQHGYSNSSRTDSLSCFGSKAGSSSKLNSVAGSRASLNDAVDVETAVRILEEIGRNASPEDMNTHQLALRSTPPPPSPRPTSTADQGISRRNSWVLNRSSSSLIRRRSLAVTPGLATRNSPADKNRRTWNSWRTPQLDPQEEVQWQVEMALANPPPALAALDLAEERRNSPSPRAVTPGDREYSHLGSLQLGTLRIANGEPSPGPSRALEDFGKETDYFAPLDVEDSPIMMKTTRRRVHARSKSAVVPASPPLYRKLRFSASIRKSKTMSRCDSPQKAEKSTVPESAPQTETLSPQFFGDDDEDEPEPIRRLRVTNKSADTLATMVTQYQADVTEEASHTQVEIDEGFVSSENLSAQEVVYRILDGTIFGEPLTTIDSSPLENISTTALNTQLVHGLTACEDVIPTLDSRQLDENATPPPAKVTSCEDVIVTAERPELESNVTRPLATKADSGYSSAGSSELVQRQAAREGSPTILEEHSMGENMSRNGNDGDLKDVHKQTEPSTPQQTTSPAEKSKTRPALLHIPSRGDQGNAGQQAGIESPRTPLSALSKVSIDSKASIIKRLQKRRPSQQELPAVQSFEPTFENTIPEVPSEVKSKFATRMAETPGMECLTQTYPSKDHIDHEERREESPMIASIESSTTPSLAPKPSRKPSQRSTAEHMESTERKRWSFFDGSKHTETDEQRGRHHSRSATERPPTPSRSLRRSLSLFRSKSKSKADKNSTLEETNEMHMLVDFGTIGTALGRSPYDAAIDAAFRRTVASPTHPHQIGDVMPRAKSMVHMDAKTASDYARARSKDRSQAARPVMPQRPKSYHQATHNGTSSHDDARHGSSRPQSSYHDSDVPPVPTLHSTYRLNSPPPTATNTTRPAPMIRARSTGRGPMVSEIVNRYDQYGDWEPTPVEWEVRSRTPSSGHGQYQRRRNYTVAASSQQQQQPGIYSPRQRSYSSSSSSWQQYQHQYQLQSQQQQQQQQHPQNPPSKLSSTYGRHSLPSQVASRNADDAASANGITPVGGRQLHSYTHPKFGTRYYGHGGGGSLRS